MTRGEAKRLLPIIQAFADGKTVQYRISSTFPRRYIRDFSYLKEWNDINEENFNGFIYDGTVNYRIKPEPKYRPFKSQEECWNEMLKHQPFSFVVSKDSIDYSGICRVFKDEKGISRITFTSNPYNDWDMDIAFDRINFADGTPFGINEKKQ